MLTAKGDMAMPKFDLIPVEEARMKSATGKRARMAQQYLGYVEQLKEGQAGRLQAAEGETDGAVRRRLGAAAKLAGKNLTIKRGGGEGYFWVAQEAVPGRRRGRPRKDTRAGA